MATVRDIARSIGVSPATVSRSLNKPSVVRKDIRDQVVAEARRMGYEVKRRRTRHGMIGMLFYNASSGLPFSGYDAVIWSGVTRAAISNKHGIGVFDPSTRHHNESFADFAERLGVDGFIVRVDQDTRHVCEELADESVPHVVVADRFEKPGVSYASCNSYDASYAAIKHLVNLGHRRIGLSHNFVLDTDHHDRIRAYRAMLADAGLETSDDLVVPVAGDMRGGASALNQLMSLPDPPTAIFFTDPQLTAAALRRSLEVGIRVPDELSIVGIDDEHLRELTYPVYTAVCQEAEKLAYQASRWLCQTLGDADHRGVFNEALRLEAEAVLEVNQTTAPPPAEPARLTPGGERIRA
ncbi:MAG: LacI family DNA-binding transcriptional regulator [Planctomycetota bacterium]